jgi:hypothetical protein
MLEIALLRNIDATLYPRAMSDLGVEFRYQEGDFVVMYRAGEKGIAKINHPRTTGVLAEIPPKTAPNASPKRRIPKGCDWMSKLRESEQYTDNAETFNDSLDRKKMVQLVTDGGARPNPEAAGWDYLSDRTRHSR